MNFTFTHSNKTEQMFFCNRQKKIENFIKQAIKCELSPSKQTLQNIKSFAESLEYRKTKSIKTINFVLN